VPESKKAEVWAHQLKYSMKKCSSGYGNFPPRPHFLEEADIEKDFCGGKQVRLQRDQVFTTVLPLAFPLKNHRNLRDTLCVHGAAKNFRVQPFPFVMPEISLQ